MRKPPDSWLGHAALATIVVGACLSGTGCDRGRARLELVPQVVSACHQPVATTAIWDVTPLGLTAARLEVNNLGRPPKPWTTGAGAGSKRAGAWARDGYTVTLKSMNGVVLARRTLTTTPCPGRDYL